MLISSAKHGTTVDYRCARRHAQRLPGDIEAVCEDGSVSFSGGSTPCFKLGTDYNITFSSNLTLKCKTVSSKGKDETDSCILKPS